MRVIRLDAAGWKSKDDFYEAILAALEAPTWHGRNNDALNDSMGVGGINGIEPPYKVWITGTRDLPDDVAKRIGWMVRGVSETRTRNYLSNRSLASPSSSMLILPSPLEGEDAKSCT
jgi:Barstar (barnase inhibitor)